MSEIEELNPRRLIEDITKQTINKTAIDAVLLRRIASALFLSLYNYWAIKSYKLYNKRYKGSMAGKNQDNFSHLEFVEEMFKNGLDKAIHELYLYRVLADHYALNPTYVTLVFRYGDKKFVKIIYTELKHDKLKKLINYAWDVLSFLEKY